MFFSQWGTMHVFFWMVGVKTFLMHVSSHNFMFSALKVLYYAIFRLKINFGHLSLDTFVA